MVPNVLATLSTLELVLQVGGLQERVAKYESELGAQAMALSTLTSQREEAQRGNTDAVERAQLLAAEVVALEEKCLTLTSDRLKAKHELDRMAEELDRATRTAKQVCVGGVSSTRGVVRGEGLYADGGQQHAEYSREDRSLQSCER